MNMNDLFISMSTAIEQIDTAVTAKGNKGLIGYVLRKCKLFDLPLYQIDQETNQIKQVHSIVSEPIYEYFKEKYPSKPKARDMLELVQPYIITYTQESFKLSEYFWRIDEFKNQTHEIFDIADMPAISYQVSQDVQELQAQIQDLQQQLQESQAHIKELESTQNVGVLKGLQKVNHDTERTRKFAQIIAKAIWDMDKTQAIRTNDMVQFLKPLILEFESTKLPNNDDTVSGWLADVKPPHATQAGRPPKNEPLEIPLIFEK